MAEPLKSYQVQTADWRQLLSRNQRRSMFVISVFILIYAALGLFIDLFIYSEQYPKIPLSTIILLLITFKLTPYVTLLTTTIAIISLWVTFTWYDKIMLLGTEYHEVTSQNAKTLLEKQLYNTIDEMRIAASLQFMPQVFIIEAD